MGRLMQGDEHDDLPPELLITARRYAAQPAPRPTAEDTTRLVQRLLTLPVEASVAVPPATVSPLSALGVARWRVRLLGPTFWVASVVLLALTVGLSLAGGAQRSILPLVALLPLSGVLGVAHALQTRSGGLREIEAACPVGFVRVTAGLTLAILGFDCALGVIATALLALLQWAPFVALLSAWLAPLMFLAAISLLVALRWGVAPAAVVGAGPWMALSLIAAFMPSGLMPGDLTRAFFALPVSSSAVGLHLLVAALGGAIVLALFARNWQGIGNVRLTPWTAR